MTGDRWRRHQVLADVRSAKARRLLPRDWPYDKPLPVDVAAALAARRAAEDSEAGR